MEMLKAEEYVWQASNIDHELLDRDSLFKAYFCGYFLADGHLSYVQQKPWHKKTLHLQIETAEKSFIEVLHKKIGFRVKVRDRLICGKIHRSYGSGVCKRFAEVIDECMDGYKNFNRYFDSLDWKHRHEFVKGFFDGDGTVCVFPDKKTVRIVFFLSGESEQQIIRKYLIDLGIVFSEGIDKRGKGVKNISVGNQRGVLKLFRSWYGEVYNQRKYEYIKRSLLSYEFKQIFVEKEGEKTVFYSVASAARAIGFTNNEICKCMKSRFKGYKVWKEIEKV
jgi:hypothetical protein